MVTIRTPLQSGRRYFHSVQNHQNNNTMSSGALLNTLITSSRNSNASEFFHGKCFNLLGGQQEGNLASQQYFGFLSTKRYFHSFQHKRALCSCKNSTGNLHKFSTNLLVSPRCPTSSVTSSCHNTFTQKRSYCPAHTREIDFKKLCLKALADPYLSARDFRYAFKYNITTPLEFRQKVISVLKDLDIVEKYIHDKEAYTSLWKKMLLGVSESNNDVVQKELMQWFTYFHANYLHALDKEVLIHWLSLLASRKEVPLMAAQFERLVNPEKFGDISLSKCLRLKNPPPTLSKKEIEERFLNADFLGQVFRQFIDGCEESSVASQYVDRYFQQYCMHPDKAPYVKPESNVLLICALKAKMSCCRNSDEFVQFVKYVFPYFDFNTLTPGQTNSLCQIFVPLSKDEKDRSSFILHLYKTYLHSHPLFLQNVNCLIALMRAHRENRDLQSAAEVFGVALTRSLLGGVPEADQPQNILAQLEKYGSVNPKYKMPTNTDTLLKQTYNMPHKKDPLFVLEESVTLYDHALSIYSDLGKWKLLRFIFESYLDVRNRGFLDRRIVVRMIHGYIQNGQMREAVAFFAQFCKGDTETFVSVPPSSKDILDIMEGFLEQKDPQRAIKFFEAAANSTSSVKTIEELNLHRKRSFYNAFQTAWRMDPSLATVSRKYMQFFK